MYLAEDTFLLVVVKNVYRTIWQLPFITLLSKFEYFFNLLFSLSFKEIIKI